MWSQLTNTNNWLYVVNKTRTIDIICNGQLYSEQLETSGVIQFHDQCVIDQPELLIRSFQNINSRLNATFAPAFNLTETLRDHSNQLKLHELNYTIEETDIDQQIQQLRSLQSQQLTENIVHNIHHYVSVYLLLIICVIIVIILYKKSVIPRLRYRIRQPSAAPQDVQATEHRNVEP